MLRRPFRPLEESITICERMILMAQNVYDYNPDPDEIEYWTRRLHGYKKLLRERQLRQVAEATKP